MSSDIGNELIAWQRPRTVGHPQSRLGAYTRASSNRSWLETNLAWQAATKELSRQRGLLPSSQSTRYTSDILLADEEEAAVAQLSGEGASYFYDYEAEQLPPSPFSPRSRISSRGNVGGAHLRSASREGLVSASEPKLDGTFDQAPSWADTSLLSYASRGSSFSSKVQHLSRTQSVSAFGKPRPWHLQPNALPRRYGVVRSFGTSPSRFPRPWSPLFGPERSKRYQH